MRNCCRSISASRASILALARWQADRLIWLDAPSSSASASSRTARSLRAVRLDAEALEEGASNQMRRSACHLANAKIDARLAEIDRQQLRMRIGHMQHTRVAECPEAVDALGACCDPETGYRRDRGC